MVVEGMILVEEARVHSHRTTKRLFPRGLRVRDAMTASPSTVTSDTPAAKVARLLLEGGRLLGVVSDRDVLRALQGRGRAESGLARWSHLGHAHGDPSSLENVTAGDVMATHLVTAPPDAPVEEAIRLMTTHRLKRLPVIDGQGRYLGTFTRDTLLRAGLRS